MFSQTPARQDKVAIYWDLESCTLPDHLNGFELVERLRQNIEKFGRMINVKAYAEITASSAKILQMRSELQSSGVTIVDCPRNGQKDVLDKMLIVDVAFHAADNPMDTIVLVAGDRDYAYLVSTLRLRQQKIVVIGCSNQAHPSLRAHSTEFIDWDNIMVSANGGHTKPSAVSEANSTPRLMDQGYSDFSYSSLNLAFPLLQDLTLEDTAARRVEAALTPVGTEASGSQPELGLKSPIQILDPSAKNLPRESLHNASSTQIALTSPLKPLLEVTKVSSQVKNPYPLQTDSILSTASAPPDLVIPGDAEKFIFLIEILEEEAKLGTRQPLRSKIAVLLKQRDPNAFSKVGVKSWKDYAKEAVSLGIVILGGEQGYDWIMLNPRRPQRPRLSSVPVHFRNLVSILEEMRLNGNRDPHRSTVQDKLLSGDLSFFVKCGYRRWTDYTDDAMQKGFVTLGHDLKGSPVVSLAPSWHGVL